MQCPFCGHQEDKVVDSRSTQSGEVIRRRRQCLECKKRFTTYERIEEIFPRIIKRDGARQDYDRLKVLQGLKLACSKRPISLQQIDVVIDAVEVRLLEQSAREVSSDWVGSCIAQELKALDPVAYIRFASVYRGFSDIEEFLTELRQMDE